MASLQPKLFCGVAVRMKESRKTLHSVTRRGPETFKRACVGSDWIHSKGGRMRLRHNTCQTTADFNDLQTF